MTWPRIGKRWPIVVVVVLGFFVALLFIIAWIASDKVKGDLWSAVAGSAIDLVFIGFIGGLLTLAIQMQLDEQEDLRRLNDYRLRLLLDVVGAYNRTKGARRALRAAGFSEPKARKFQPWQIDQFRIQLAEINEAQLAIEKIGRELDVDLGELTDLQAIRDKITAVDKYLGRIIEGWEANGERLASGDKAALASQSTLAGFLKHKLDAGATFDAEMRERMNFIENSIRTDMQRAGSVAARARRPRDGPPRAGNERATEP